MWSLTLREEHRLRVFENRALRKIFGTKRDEVTGEWRRLHNEELYGPYCSPNIFRVSKLRRISWAGHVARVGEKKMHAEFWWGEPEGKKPFGRPRRRWADNVKLVHKAMG
jgi:hypothetical protein